ncbi:hypothetical protein [Yoonia sp. SS1-5]|uniref:Uncharacterized protein n=1 Tax=Yoonia rhodophyticola TaxID=3137370 RepID=A0AAN0MDR8_9RHOB
MRLTSFTLALAVCASPALAVDDCLIGTWQADLAGLADIMAGQMNGTATPVGGSVTMQITPDGVASMNVNNMVINVVVPNAPAMDVGVNGVSSGNFTAEGGRWTVATSSYNLVGSANVMGQTMTIPFDSSTGMMGGGSGTYDCSSSAVTFQTDGPNPTMPPSWTRAG